MNEDFMVLVVEDDSLTRNVILDILRDDGLQTAESDGFAATLKIFQPGKFKVVVLDNQLGDGIGIDLCRQLVALDNAIKIYLFAGSVDEVRLEALAAGAAEVLQKPYDLTKLPFLIKREMRRTQDNDNFPPRKTK